MRILKRENIDVEKWNSRVKEDQEALPYMYSDYLDAVCNNWMGIVFGDYDSFIPLCWNRKWGIKYVYQPPFLQRMQIVGDKHDISIQKKIYKAVNKNFLYVDFKLNFYGPNSSQRANYLLDLSKSYQVLSSKYSSQIKRNLKKKEIEIREIDDIEVILEMYKLYTIPKVDNWRSVFDDKQRNLLNALILNKQLKMYGAYYEKELIASNALVEDGRRIILLMSASTEKGRDLSGFSFIVDFIIQSNSGKEIILDFEGSEIPGIAKFNEGFGAESEIYYHWKWINWFWK